MPESGVAAGREPGDLWGTMSPETLETLLPPLLDSAYRVALRLTRDPADAEDLVQEAAFLAAKGFHTYQQGTNFKAWFFRVLTNAFYSKYRRNKRQGQQVDIDETPDAHLYRQTSQAGWHGGERDPVDRLLSSITVEQVSAAMDQLPDEYRDVATLYFEEDLAYQDIAAALDVPVGTVRSRLHRARKLLQHNLWQVAVEAGVIPQDKEANG